MTRRRYDVDQIKASWTIEAALQTIGWDTGTHRKCRCPLPECADRDSRKAGTFWYQIDRWYCHRCKVGGDVIRLIQLINGCDFKAACAALSHGDVDMIPDVPEAKRRAVREQVAVLTWTRRRHAGLHAFNDALFDADMKDLRYQLKNRLIDRDDAVFRHIRITTDGIRNLQDVLDEEHLAMFAINGASPEHTAWMKMLAEGERK